MSDPLSTLDGVSGHLGLRWDTYEVCRMTIRPELINLGGLLSGVATYGMVDYGMGRALWKQISEDESIATVNIAINYVQSATEGELICTSTVDRRNRRLAVLRSEVVHQDGRLIATAIGSYTIFPRKR
jgi:uncharacterized protein (TIGR00369 family)